ASEKFTQLCAPLHPIVFNDLYCLARPEVHTLSLGAARPSDFDLHLEAVKMVPKALEVLPPIVARLAGAMKDAVAPHLRDPFRLGLPEPEETPGEFNLPITLWLRNLTLAFDLLEYSQMRYNLFGNAGHWFPGKPFDNLDEIDLTAVAQKS